MWSCSCFIYNCLAWLPVLPSRARCQIVRLNIVCWHAGKHFYPWFKRTAISRYSPSQQGFHRLQSQELINTKKLNAWKHTNTTKISRIKSNNKHFNPFQHPSANGSSLLSKTELQRLRLHLNGPNSTINRHIRLTHRWLDDWEDLVSEGWSWRHAEALG